MTRLIKKYKNRRLYDMEKSQYITIDDLQKYVIEGLDFQVEDSATSEDLTAQTLLQILVEMEHGTNPFLSAQMLKQLIKFAQHPLNQSFKKTLSQLFSSFETNINANPYQKEYEKISEAWQKTTDDLMKQWQGLFKS